MIVVMAGKKPFRSKLRSTTVNVRPDVWVLGSAKDQALHLDPGMEMSEGTVGEATSAETGET